MVERTLVLAAVLERAAEREMEMERISRLKVAVQRRLHRGDVAIGECETLEVGEAPPRGGVPAPPLFVSPVQPAVTPWTLSSELRST
jgi:hypothetical protein